MWHPNIDFLYVAYFFKWFQTVIWLMFSVSAISWQLTWWYCYTKCKISSTFPVNGWPERGASLTSKFPEQNRANHSWVTEFTESYFTIYFTNCSACFCGVLTFFIVKKHHIAYFFRYFNHYKIYVITFYACNYLKKLFSQNMLLKCHLLSICIFVIIWWVWNNI